MIPYDRIAKTMPMLGSDNDSEALATARALGRILVGSGSSFVELADKIGAMKPNAPQDGGLRGYQPPQNHASGFTWYARRTAHGLRTDLEKAKWCADFGGFRLSEKERAFVNDLAVRLGRYGGRASERQVEWLEAILGRLRRAAA